MGERRVAKIAAISCTHCPFAPDETVNWVLDNLANTKGLTHFIHCGDIVEAAAASVHPNEYDHSLDDEFCAAAELLEKIRSVLPSSCKLVVTMGNHDDNLISKDPRRIPKQIRSLVDWKRHPKFGEEAKQWEWLPYTKDGTGIFRVGQVHIWHGFDSGQSSDELEGLQMISHGGWIPHSLAVRGHTHRPCAPTQCKRTAKIPLPYYYCNVGTCGPLAPDWAKRKDRSQWGAGMLMAEVVWDKPSRLNGKCWEAELLVK